MITNETKIGTFSYFGYELPFQQRVELIQQAGFGSTFIWLGPENDLITKGQSDSVPQITRDHGLYLESAHAAYTKCIDIWSSNASNRNNRVKEYFKDIEFCSKHSIPFLVIHITGSHMDPIPNKYGIDSLKKIVEVARNNNVIIAAENARQPNFHDFVFENIESPNLRICYDSSHDFIRSDHPTQILKRWADQIVLTHFSDNDGHNDSHWPPTEGTIDWELILKNFPKGSYSSSIMLEAFPQDPASMTPQKYLHELYRRGEWLKNQLLANNLR